jgi:hypothetical protein
MFRFSSTVMEQRTVRIGPAPAFGFHAAAPHPAAPHFGRR